MRSAREVPLREGPGAWRELVPRLPDFATATPTRAISRLRASAAPSTNEASETRSSSSTPIRSPPRIPALRAVERVGLGAEGLVELEC